MALQSTSFWQNGAGDGSSATQLMCIIGGAELSIWAVRPSICLCKLRRHDASLRTHGSNEQVLWAENADEAPGHRSIVVRTSKSFVIKYSLTQFGKAATSSIYAVSADASGASAGQFLDGPGEAGILPSLVLRQEGMLDFGEDDAWSMCATSHALLVGTANPPALHSVAWDVFGLEDDADQEELVELHSATLLQNLTWVANPAYAFTSMTYVQAIGLYIFTSADGRAYAVKDLAELNVEYGDQSPQRRNWDGQCFYGLEGDFATQQDLPSHAKARKCAYNDAFSLLAIGLQNGTCLVFDVLQPSHALVKSHEMALKAALKTTASQLHTGPVQSLSWTSDGYALAVGWTCGWAVWTVYGRLTTWSVGVHASGTEDADVPHTFEDSFINGIRTMAWLPGNLELWALCDAKAGSAGNSVDSQLYIIPFAKSATTGLHTPDNTNNAFLQTDDSLLVYRGVDQPDMSIINPDSDVWQQIKIPPDYITENWPIRYACISADARLIAVSGTSGFAHYNSLSGRWKVFSGASDTQYVRVCGGMQWHGTTLVVATHETDISGDESYKLRLCSRESPPDIAYCLDEEVLPSKIVLTSLFDNSLLVYTEDNTFYHFLLDTQSGAARLRVCGSIGFEGVVNHPLRVRGLSWLVPKSQHLVGDPSDDLNLATIIFLIEGKLVLLRPRNAIREEVKYDMQILATRIEFYWTHLSGIGTLENSLWGWDGQQIRVWLNSLTVDADLRPGIGRPSLLLENVEESLAIAVDFYPLSVLMDKGMIVGVEQETSFRRNLDFTMFRLVTSTHLFLQHVLRFHLTNDQLREAVVFASHYQHLLYFAHALEILLHTVLEDEADALSSSVRQSIRSNSGDFSTPGIAGSLPIARLGAVLPLIIDFLDHFDEALQVVVNCARKTEVKRWGYLFQFVGKPRGLFEECMSSGNLKIAASYLLVLHNLEPIEQSSTDTIRLLKAAIARDDWQLCKELSRFLFSLDHTGQILFTCLHEAGALPPATSERYGSPETMRGTSNGYATLNGEGISSQAGLAGEAAAELSTSNSINTRSYPEAVPFRRTGSSAQSLHYRMASAGHLGLGTLLSRVGQPPSPIESLRISRSNSRDSTGGLSTSSSSDRGLQPGGSGGMARSNSSGSIVYKDSPAGSSENEDEADP